MLLRLRLKHRGTVDLGCTASTDFVYERVGLCACSLEGTEELVRKNKDISTLSDFTGDGTEVCVLQLGCLGLEPGMTSICLKMIVSRHCIANT